jgi:hypothetical protein
MKRDWSRAGLPDISQIVSTRSFGDYDEDDLEAMIVKCDGWLVGGDPVIMRVCVANKESLQRALDQRRADAERRRREAAEAERHQQHTVLEKEKLGHLTGIKEEVNKISRHAESLDNRVTGIDERVARNEHHVDGIHREAKRATLIGFAALACALVVPLLEHFGCRAQREADANQNPNRQRSTITNSSPGVAATATNGH